MIKQILLVEDLPDDAKLLERILRLSGVENPIHTSLSGEDALCYLKGEGIYSDRELYPFPKVLFLDLVMPGLDGWDVLRWLHAQPKRTEKLFIFVLTGNFDRPQIEEAYRLGADSFLVKPLKPEELKQLFRSYPSGWIITPPPPPVPPDATPGNHIPPGSQTG
jgi:CheY-like chemotaxis protein